MFEIRENLCKSVIGQNLAVRDWQDQIYLADSCKERFVVQSEIAELGAEGITMAGLADLSDGYIVERKLPEIHTLLFTQAGGGRLLTKQGIQQVEANTVTILPEGIPFRFELGDNNYWQVAWILLPKTHKWQQLDNSAQRVEPTHMCESVWSILNLLHQEGQDRGLQGRSTFRQLLLSELTRILLGSTDSQPSNASLRVQSVFNQVEAQLHLPWTVKEIAKRSFLSEEQLNRISKQLYQQTPSQQLIRFRMEKAADLLRHRDWTIAMIAHRLGYPDPFNFTHRFRKYHGLSPRDFRKQYLSAIKGC
ncbi:MULTISPECIES: AraC family transcriptional regulator [Vibrio]|uniref:Helix-turn-helix domain-containing protein n=1 Tax=Vibrio algicola TaxID=2662262 RepID=A0A5Q0TI92_9VIBR|nr:MULTISPECIES: AraC family transcriptional regulator [Vibrio]MBD1575932.1 AraC family transcriptional regulator [Vibrio sp. S11_S32]